MHLPEDHLCVFGWLALGALACTRWGFRSDKLFLMPPELPRLTKEIYPIPGYFFSLVLALYNLDFTLWFWNFTIIILTPFLLSLCEISISSGLTSTFKANTIASEPLHGWRLNNNHSHVSLEWLHWEDSKLHRIQHARNKGEFRIPNSNCTVDGYDEVTKTVYEFQGCFFHGCRMCYPTRSEPHRRLEDRSMEVVYLCTQRKILDLESRGYTVKQMWKCQWV